MSDSYRRRRLRLGALLYRLQYYAIPDHRDDEGQITLYRHDPAHSVEVARDTVRLVGGAIVEELNLEAAIDRCKEALRGQPLHCGAGDAPRDATV
jgi:hypothetical protein